MKTTSGANVRSIIGNSLRSRMRSKCDLLEAKVMRASPSISDGKRGRSEFGATARQVMSDRANSREKRAPPGRLRHEKARCNPRAT